MPGQSRRILANALLVVVSLGVFALIGEGVIRLWLNLLSPKMMVLDDTLGWRHARNKKKVFQNEFGERVLVVQDEYGNRGTGHPIEKPTGKFRVLALGDSFTEAIQVGEDDVFTSQLEHADPNLDVVNTGVGGYGTVQEYLYLMAEGIQFHPDLVLLMFYDNDLTDNLLNYYPGFGPRPYATLTNAGVQIIQTLDSSSYRQYILPAPFQMALNEHSYLYYFVNSRLYQPFFASRMRQMQQADLNRITVSDEYSALFGVLDKLKSSLAAQHIPLVVVVIPKREDVAKGSSEITDTISEFCRKENLDCLPLIDGLRQQSAPGRELYFREDMHWAKDGHRVAANEILNHLRSRGAELSVRR